MARKATNNKKDERDDSKDLKGGPGKYSRKLAAFWKKEVTEVEDVSKNWWKKGDMIIKRFRDERKASEAASQRRLNIFWANYKILKPALYGKAPSPIVERKFLQRDPVGRLSSIMLERNVRNQMELNGLHTSISRAVSDYLIPGRGVVWVRYEPEIGDGDSLPVTSEGGIEDELGKIEKEFGEGGLEESEKSEKLENTGEQLLSEQAPVDYIDWKDFLMFPARARTWDEVQAVGKRVCISREEAIERFGEEVGKALQPDTTPANEKSGRATDNTTVFHDLNERSIVCYEIWNKTDRRIYWISTGYEYLCDVKDDFLKLKRFFPTPEPISSTLTNDSLQPIPDYWEYQDQAIQIDEITQRLAMLTKACKVAGTYDASNGPLKRLLQEGFENDLLPVESWAVFAEKGGVKGGISLLPIDEIQKVIETLQKVRQQLIQDLDLISGVTDIQRGTTDSRETLGGIKLKNNNTGSRLSERQNEVARFARDTVCIVAEIAAKHFSEKTLIQASGILFDDDLQPESVMEELMSAMPQQQPQLPSPMPGMPNMAPQSPQGGGNVIPFPQQSQMGMPTQMSGMSGMMAPQMPMPDPQMIIMQRIQKSIDLLRNEVPLGYRIDVETDSTIFGDAAQERKDAVEFISGTTQFLGQVAPLAEQIPEAIPMFGRMLQWGVRKFRVGRDLESSIDDFVRKIDKKTKELTKNPRPDPEQQKSQAELQKVMLENQAAEKQIQMEQQAQAVNDQRDFQKQQAEDQREAQLSQMEIQHKEREMAMNMEFRQAEHAMKMQELNRQAALKHMEHNAKLQQMHQETVADQQEHHQTMQLNEQQHNQQKEQTELKTEAAEKQHKLKMQQMKSQKNKPKPKGK